MSSDVPPPPPPRDPESSDSGNPDPDSVPQPALPGGETPEKKKASPIVRVFFRGLAISLPPILTLVILLWLFGLIRDYVITPVNTTVQYTIAQFVREDIPKKNLVRFDHQPPLEFARREDYLLLPAFAEELQTVWDAGASDQETLEITVRNLIESNYERVLIPFGERAVPYDDYAKVARTVPPGDLPKTVNGTYMELVTIEYFPSLFHLSAVGVVLTVVLLWFLGGLMTARMGRWAVSKFETTVVGRLPLVSNVYSSVKQVTDFFFTERTVSYNRVVAVQYPRRGVYSIGFVTGDSMLEITAEAGEPLLAVLMPTSPMPMTGFTISVPRSEVIDLNITIDQAFQFCLSCGVLVPGQQRVTPELLQQELSRRLTGAGTGRTVIDSYQRPRNIDDGDDDE